MAQKFKADFLCVGFEKCATTSLDAVLRQHNEIALPAIKEIHLFDWHKKCEDPVQVMKRKFFKELSHGKKVGIIDHTLSDAPNLVYRYFDKDVKLIFMMRNPVERLFSFYRMALWFGFPTVFKSTLNGKETDCVSRSFDRYVQEELKKDNKCADITHGCYIDKIMMFKKYYDIENMKFILFEDYVVNPEGCIRQILDFLLLPYEKMDFNLWEIKGDRVPKNKICFKINREMSLMFDRARRHPGATAKQFDRAYINFLNMCKVTTKNSNEKMSDRARKQLENYYRPSVEKLEDFLNMDLSSKWF